MRLCVWLRLSKEMLSYLPIWSLVSHACRRSSDSFSPASLKSRRRCNRSGRSCRCLGRCACPGLGRRWCAIVVERWSKCCFDGLIWLRRSLGVSSCRRIIVLDNTVVRFWSLSVHSAICAGKRQEHSCYRVFKAKLLFAIILLIDGYLINVLCAAHAVKLSGGELLCCRSEKIPSAFCIICRRHQSTPSA